MVRLRLSPLTHFPSILLLLILGLSSLFSQHHSPIRCATNEAEAWMQSHVPDWPNRAMFERQIQEQMQMQDNRLRDEDVVTIPIIVHIVHDGEPVGFGSNISAAQVQSQIEVLNEDYRRLIGTPGHNTDPNGADIEIEFCLASLDQEGNVLPEQGIHRIDRNARGWGDPPFSIGEVKQQMMPVAFWDPESYMNMWTVELSDDFLGFAQLPNFSTLPDLSPNHGPASTDGVVIAPTAFGRIGTARAPYNQGRTTTHEVGHWLGLWHIWGDGPCGVDDYCDDTPEASDPNYGCPDPENSCGELQVVNNYMDYSDDICMNLFTSCQKTRMRTALSNAARRFSLTTSGVCFGEAVPVAQFQGNRQFVCAGSTVRFAPEEGNFPQTYQWSFPGGTPSSSTDQQPAVTYEEKGAFPVTVIVSNEFGSDTLTKSSYITVDTAGSEVIFFENFESGLSRWQIDNPDNDITWQLELVEGTDSGQIAVGINLYDYTVSGERDGLISPTFDLSGYEGATLRFSHAYRQATQGDRDSLIIYASTDGGSNYNERIFAAREDGSEEFATNSATNERFVPQSRSDWCYGRTIWSDCSEINLTTLTGTERLTFKFEAYNGFGNDIYIDEISLKASCVPIWEQPADSVGHPFLFTLFPNPSEGDVSLRLFLDEPEFVILRLYDISGKEVYYQLHEDVPTLTEVEISVPELPDGVYIMRIRAGKYTRFTKLIIRR